MEFANNTTSMVRLCQKIPSNLYDIGFHKLPTMMEFCEDNLCSFNLQNL